jgi:hypothetical protein
MWHILFRPIFRRILLGLIVLPAIGWQVLAETGYDDLSTSEGWAWAQIKQGEEADFNSQCRTEALDPRRDDETRWENGCRRLSATFLIDVLTKVPWRTQVPFAGVQIIGARIVGDINLQNARLDRQLYIDRSRIENDIKLKAVRADSNIVIVGSRVTGAVSADYFHGELLDLSRSEFRKRVALDSAELQSHVLMDGAVFESELNAIGMKVGGSLVVSAHHGTTFKCTKLQTPCVILTSVNVNVNSPWREPLSRDM